MPDILDRCVEKLKKQGRKESSAYAICTATLKKAGKLDDDFIDSLEEIEEDSLEFDELVTYAEEGVLELWTAPTKRKDVPSSHFFDPKNKRYPYRNPDGSVNCGGVMAAWKMAHGARSGKKASPAIIAKIKPYHDRCMNKTSKEKKQSEVHHSLSFPVSFPENIDLSAPKPIDIQILKRGKFRHPYYGILNFNDDFFDSMIRNFEADIPQADISFDFSHRPDWGAAAWVQNLYKNDGEYMATVELTEKGRESIKKKEFRFFSSTYTDDYVEYVFEEGSDDDGNTVDKEYKINHGPTLLGGGLTNRPFLKGMKPVSLSEDGSQIELEEIMEEETKDKEVNGKMAKQLKDLEKERDDLQKKIKDLESKEDEDSKKELKSIKDSLEKVLEAITKAEKSDEEDDDKDNGNEKSMEDIRKELTEANKKIKALEEVENKNKELSGKVTDLTNTVNGLLEDKKVMAEEKRQVLMKEAVREMKEELGVFPSTLKIVEGVLMSESSNGIEITLSEGEGENKKEVKKDLAAIFKEIFESIPDEFRFSDEEDSESVTSATGKTSEMTVAKVEEYAKEHNLSYEDALIELDKQNKL